ncbi:elongation factor Ts, mitochondrial [Silene latifolia]|uniref:elongation factor Ts, mitochondrial n=1 Tax=Silene latifolia TaxID=37657 RepID=UPI003D76D42A
MAFNASAKLAIRVLYRKNGSKTHGFSTMVLNRRSSQSIVDDVHSVGMLSRNYSSASSSPEKADQMSRIKELRELTSAPIKDVKSALVDCDWNIEAAQKELRKRGVYLAAKKSSRTASEGLLALASDNNRTAVIELNCETDFVARNDIFQYVALSLAKLALSEGPSQQVSEALPLSPDYLERLTLNLAHPKLSGEKSVQEAVIDLAAMMGENVKLRRCFSMSKNSPGVISTYLHSSPQLGLGRIAGLLSLEVEDPNTDLTKLQSIGSEIAMHIVAEKPLFLTKELVSADTLESEREILRSQAEASGKPQMAIEKMVEGRLRKYYEDVVLMEQKYVLNDTMKVATVLDNLSKEVGCPVKIGSFVRLEVGEGIESAEANESETMEAQAV